MIVHSYGPKLVDFRKKAGLTQSDIAKALKLSTPQFVSNWERGNARVPAKTVGSLASLYKVKREVLCKIVVADIARHVEKQIMQAKTKGAKKARN